VFRYTARQVLGGVASMDISNQLERASWARRPE
jgi:hypothetical protein